VAQPFYPDSDFIRNNFSGIVLGCLLFIKINGNYSTHLCNISKVYLNIKKDIEILV